jgi:hypothetical protein
LRAHHSQIDANRASSTSIAQYPDNHERLLRTMQCPPALAFTDKAGSPANTLVTSRRVEENTITRIIRLRK